MKKYLPFSRRQPSLDRFAVSRGGWGGSDKFSGKSLRRTSAASLNTRSIQVVRGAYNIDLNKVDSSFTKLHRACLLNDDAQVKKHINKVDNNSHDSSNRYPIHLATVNGNMAIIKQLIENGANPNVRDNEGNTPLIKSIECGHEHLVKYFLCNNADPNLSDLDNNTALHWAIMTESIIAIDALLSSKKCDLSARNNKDEACLHLAVRSPLINTNSFELMLKSGSDLNAKDQLGLTVLDIARACNNKVAINAFNRYVHDIESDLDRQTITERLDDKQSDTDEDKTANQAKKMCEEYKQKYILKSRENLDYEKKLIHLNAQIERLRLDVSYARERNEKLEADYNKVLADNTKLKGENDNLRKQISSSKRTGKSDCRDEISDEELGFDGIDFDAVESIDCRGHQDFLVAKALNQERINKLKSGLPTL